MMLYRLTESEFADTVSLFNGLGASRGGGRWNPVDTRAIYCSGNPITCGAELGFHKIVVNVAIYNVITPNSGKKKFAKNKLIDNRKILAQFSVELEENQILDLTSDEKLSEALKILNLEFPSISIQDFRRSDYTDLHTQAIGREACNKGFRAIKAQSARHHDFVFILFPENIPVESFKLIGIKKASLSAVKSNDKKLTPGAKAEDSKVLFSVGLQKQVITVLQL